MGDWLYDEFVASGKLPLILCFVSFIVTFAVTRLSTRMIRAGKGPFRDKVTSGGVHVHHAVYGIVLLTSGAVLALGAQTIGWRSVAGVLAGSGMSLVLDEFALILHLQDVYWTQEGRLSIDVISLTAAFLLAGPRRSHPARHRRSDGWRGLHAVGRHPLARGARRAVGALPREGKVRPVVVWSVHTGRPGRRGPQDGPTALSVGATVLRHRKACAGGRQGRAV